MEKTDEIEKLIALGMTENEAKVYVTLLAEYPVTGYQAAKRAGITRSMVYETLSRLEARGAVLKSKEENATYYRPVDPKVILDRYETNTKEQIEELRSSLIPIFTRKTDGKVWNFTGRPEALRHASEMISSATDEVMIVADDTDLETIEPTLRDAAERGLKIGVMLTGDADFDVGEVIRHPKNETVLHHLEETFVAVTDETECIIVGSGRNSLATVTTNANLVLITRQYIWMELFSQRVFSRLGDGLLNLLDEDDRRVLRSDIGDIRGDRRS